MKQPNNIKYIVNIQFKIVYNSRVNIFLKSDILSTADKINTTPFIFI